jgi:hypothetical protein
MKFKPMNFSLNSTASFHKNGMEGEGIGSRPMEKQKEFNFCFDNVFCTILFKIIMFIFFIPAAEHKCLKRGVKEVVKSIRRGHKG